MLEKDCPCSLLNPFRACTHKNLIGSNFKNNLYTKTGFKDRANCNHGIFKNIIFVLILIFLFDYSAGAPMMKQSSTAVQERWYQRISRISLFNIHAMGRGHSKDDIELTSCIYTPPRARMSRDLGWELRKKVTQSWIFPTPIVTVRWPILFRLFCERDSLTGFATLGVYHQFPLRVPLFYYFWILITLNQNHPLGACVSRELISQIFQTEKMVIKI